METPTPGQAAEEGKNAVNETLDKAADAATVDTRTPGEAFQEDKSTASEVLDKATEKENQALKAVEKVQSAVGQVTPVPDDFDAVSSPSELKARLEWGEPALSILDVRDRQAFNKERITGAMPMPISNLVESAKTSFESERDLFIYGETDEETAAAVTQLHEAGFEKVSAIKGGLPAWKAIGGPIEGRTSL
ncbi:MAG: rhodanese-like domain-containing protein [Phormidesmis sp.]